MDVANNVRTKVGTNLFGKGQRVISDAYRKGYDAINWNKEEEVVEDNKPHCIKKVRCSKDGVTTLVKGDWKPKM